MKDFHLNITPEADDTSARATLKHGEKLLVDIQSDDWQLLAAAVLLAVGYEGLRLEQNAGVRVLNGLSVLVAIRDRLDLEFNPLAPTLGLVTLSERYSEELEEHRYDVMVNGVPVEGTLDARGRWKDIKLLLVMLSA